MGSLGVDTRLSSLGHAQTDGASERAIQTVRQVLRALARDHNSLGLWRSLLPRVVYSYNATRQSTTGYSPFYLATLRTPRTLLTVNNIRSQWSEADTEAFLDALYQENTDTIVRAGARSARYHDRSRKPFPDVKKGDKVLVHSGALGKHGEATAWTLRHLDWDKCPRRYTSLPREYNGPSNTSWLAGDRAAKRISR